MYKFLMLIMAITATCTMSHAQNPFFDEFKSTPRGAVPFDKIAVTDYEPAIERGIRLGLEAVDAIVNNPDAPTFDNTIVALEMSDRDLNRFLWYLTLFCRL